MKIYVSRLHIDESLARDSHHCMIADAVKAAVPTAQYILVDLQTIRYSDSKRRLRVAYLTPPIAQRSLLRFDRGDKTLKPFSFTLHRSIRVRSMGWNGQSDRTAQQRKGKRYRKTGLVRAMVAYKVREFGLRVFKGAPK